MEKTIIETIKYKNFNMNILDILTYKYIEQYTNHAFKITSLYYNIQQCKNLKNLLLQYKTDYIAKEINFKDFLLKTGIYTGSVDIKTFINNCANILLTANIITDIKLHNFVNTINQQKYINKYITSLNNHIKNMIADKNTLENNHITYKIINLNDIKQAKNMQITYNSYNILGFFNRKLLANFNQKDINQVCLDLPNIHLVKHTLKKRYMYKLERLFNTLSFIDFYFLEKEQDKYCSYIDSFVIYA